MAHEIELEFRFGAPSHILFNIFSDEKELSKLTLCPAEIELKEGGLFRLYDGRIVGEVINFIPGERLEEKWKMNDWSDYSHLTLEFIGEGGECLVKLSQKEIPVEVDIDSVEKGWTNNIFQNIQNVIGIPLFK